MQLMTQEQGEKLTDFDDIARARDPLSPMSLELGMIVSSVSNVARARDGNPLCLLVCLSCRDMFEVKIFEG
jgi:hypothetical protein